MSPYTTAVTRSGPRSPTRGGVVKPYASAGAVMPTASSPKE